MVEKIKKYIPNILTTLRLMVVPVFWLQFLTGNFGIATTIFASACITDAIDGNLARRWKVESRYGKIVDPIADKTLVMSALLLYSIKINPIMFLSLGLEAGIAVVNTKAFIKRADIDKLESKKPRDIINFILKNGNGDVNKIGKKKTIGLMTEVSIALLTTALKLPATQLVNLLTLSTATLQGATLSEYVEKHINDSNNTKDNTENKLAIDVPETVNKESKEIKSTLNSCDMKQKLKKELEFLNSKNNLHKLSKNKVKK